MIFGGMFDTLVGLFFKILLGATAVLAAALVVSGEAGTVREAVDEAEEVPSETV